MTGEQKEELAGAKRALDDAEDSRKRAQAALEDAEQKVAQVAERLAEMQTERDKAEANQVLLALGGARDGLQSLGIVSLCASSRARPPC